MKVFFKILGPYKEVDIKNTATQLILDYILKYKHDFKNPLDSC